MSVTAIQGCRPQDGALHLKQSLDKQIQNRTFPVHTCTGVLNTTSSHVDAPCSIITASKVMHMPHAS